MGGEFYPDGFTNSAAAIGSVYRYTNGQPVLGSGQWEVQLTGGDLPQNFTRFIGFGAQSRILALSENKPTFTLATSSGLLTGSVVNPVTGISISIKGIVLQKQQLGAGFFLGTTQSGRMLLDAKP